MVTRTTLGRMLRCTLVVVGALAATTGRSIDTARAQSMEIITPLSTEGLYPNVSDMGARKLSVSLVYGAEPTGEILRRLAIVDVTPGASPRGVQHVFEPVRSRITLGGQTYLLGMREVFNQAIERNDVEITVVHVTRGADGKDLPGHQVSTTLAVLADQRARQAREGRMRAQLGDATYWVAASFFSSQSGFLFFPEASIRMLDDPKADRLAIQPRYVVMTTERRAALDERLAADNRIGDTPFAVSWDESRLGWVVRRLSR